MNFFLLYPTEVGQRFISYDCARKFLVSAQNEQSARVIAQAEGGYEVHFQTLKYNADGMPFWTDPTLTACVPLVACGTEGVVIRDFWHG